ncbi:sulfite exporter TauE/SafE family protein [Oceanobacillus jeddahense]|uniref:sulfite exporter TauE/SafE family protein n=1 Tax=Oceanobacillus jeddahense TaxID=1462527 RepID=UPI000595B06A|nr:sulfite exporter TauE/SafE family protein [Oceanobacillus jeddahense]
MEVTTAIFILIIGIIAGGYGTIVGAGGGFIFVPALLILLNIDPVAAAASGLVIVFINTFSAIIGYAKQKNINYRIGGSIIIGAIPSSVLGAWLLQFIDANSKVFYWSFASILLIFGIVLLYKNSNFSLNKKKSNIDITLQIKTYRLILLGLLMGIISSFLGIGGGWLLVPILIYLFGLSVHQAAATSIFSLCIYSLVGVSTHIFYNNVNWSIVFWGGLGVIIGAQLGVFIAKKLSGQTILKMLSIVLCIVGVRMYFS